jgi:solute carrier family 35 protein E3
MIKLTRILSLATLPTITQMLDMTTIFAMFGNVGSVVGVVIMNKYIVAVDAFNFMIFLSFTHFVFTYLGCSVLLHLGFFNYKPAPIRGVLPVALGSLGSVAFMNLNLAHNSVGFYQLSKLACIPVTIALERAFYGKTVPGPVLVTLIPITIGVGIATVNDVSVNLVGTAFAALAVLFTSLAQIFTSTYQKQLDCDALQLLYHSSPLIAAGSFLMIPFFDNVRYLVQTSFSLSLLNHVLSSCVLALGVNISNYLVLGKTSPLTYQVLGHLKTILILVLGFVVFKYKSNARAVVGILIALGGVIAYTELKRRMSLQQGGRAGMSSSHSGLRRGFEGLSYSKVAADEEIPDGEIGGAGRLELMGAMKV